MPFASRLTRRLGLVHPIVQGGMSWASSHHALPLAVSRAGGLGVLAAGPMTADAVRDAVRAIKAGTPRPFAVNVPLSGRHAAAHLDVAFDERVPVLIASQGGPGDHVTRFRDAGLQWWHVVASVEHAVKAERAGVDAVVAVGGEAGGHPAPSEVGSLVLVRAVVRAVHVPVVGAGGVADGAGMAAMCCLGAEAVQLGTRFLLTRESHVHPAYKAAALRAGIADTTLVGRGRLPVRVIKNAFTSEVEAAERRGAPTEELLALYGRASLKAAALDGDVDLGKLEAGQSVGLIDDLPSADDVVRRLVEEFDIARARLAGMEA
ncbi:MAG: nitronate monooxygenase family protein [Vicinamibacterales bacterium]